jgi:hypothetical protein
MDMFSGDLENWLNEVDVQDGYHAELLAGILKERDFSEHDDASNIQYAFEMAKWVSGHFEYLTYACSDEIDGEVLPDTIKAVIAHDWRPAGEVHIVYPSGSKLRLLPNSEEHRVSGPSTLEKIIKDALDDGSNMSQVVDTASQMAELDEDIIEEHHRLKSDTVIFETVEVVWEHPLSHRDGLKFTVSPTEIKVIPFATADYGNRLFEFAVGIQQEPTSLAEIVSKLAVLAAQNCMPRTRQYFTDRGEIEDFKKKLAKI